MEYTQVETRRNFSTTVKCVIMIVSQANCFSCFFSKNGCIFRIMENEIINVNQRFIGHYVL